MQVRLCDKYGFDEAARQWRLQLFDFSKEDRLLAQLLHDTVIRENKDQIIEQFYDFLLGCPETAVFISASMPLQKLKNAHSQYLQTLGVDFEEESYFEQRLKVGLVHESIGLPLSLYHAAYCVLQNGLISSIPDDLTLEDKAGLTQFVIKITGLDMSLATDTYHTVQVDNLTSSIINLRHEEQRLSFQVKQDTLTGAASRDYLLTALERELEHCRKSMIPSCIAMIDLDHFKQVNDSYGHLVGDEILKGVVGRIKSRMRNPDVIGRYGGEEFLLIFPNTKLVTVIDIVERIRQHVAASPFHVEEQSIPVTISAGVTDSQKNDTIDSWIARTDDLMYQAKHNGRNRIEF